MIASKIILLVHPKSIQLAVALSDTVIYIYHRFSSLKTYVFPEVVLA